MRTLTGNIQGHKVTIHVVEAGEKHSQVRLAAGIALDDEYTLTLCGEDFDDAGDMRSSFPGAANLIENAGIDLDSIRGYIEVIN